MYDGALYGTAYALRWTEAGSGVRHLCEVQRLGYAGPETALGPPLAAVHRAGAEGGAAEPLDVLAPLVGATAELTVPDRAHGRLAAVSAAQEAAWRLVWRTAPATASIDGPRSAFDTVKFWGPLSRAYYVDTPSEGVNAVRLVFDAGLGLLEDRAVAGPGVDAAAWPLSVDAGDPGTPTKNVPAERVVQTIARVLSSMGDHARDVDGLARAAAGLSVAVDLRPWLPGDDHVASTTDPLFALATLEAAWTGSGGESDSALAALRGLAGRFGARLVPSAGRWWLVERRLLCEDPAAVPVASYGLTDETPGAVGVRLDASASAAPAAADLTAWLTRGRVERAPARELTLPVREVTSPYAFDPPLDNLILNGSFERAGGTRTAGTNSVWADDEAGAWEHVYNAFRADYDGMLANLIAVPVDPAYGDRFGLVLAVWNPDESDSRAYVVQRDRVVVPAGAGFAFRASFDLFADLDGAIPTDASISDYGGLALEIGPHVLAEQLVTVRADVLAGDGVRVKVTPLLAGVAGAVDGTLVLPAGARLDFRPLGSSAARHAPAGTLTLTRPASVGDDVLVGDLSGAVDAGATARVAYWEEASSASDTFVGAGGAVDLRGGFTSRTVYAAGVAPDGTPIGGPLTVFLVGLEANTSSGNLDGYYVIDDAELALVPLDEDGSLSGQAAAELAHRVALPAGAHGLVAELPAGRAAPAYPVGDGPLAHTYTRLLAQGPSLAWHATAQGEDTGWKAGAYAASEPSTGLTLDALLAREALRQVAGPDDAGLERWRGGYRLGPGEALHPHEVPVLPQKTGLAHYAASGTDEVTVWAAVPPGAALTLSPGRAEEEAATVAACAPAALGYVLTLAAPLTNSHYAGAGAVYARPYALDGYEHDAVAGALYLDATALTLRPTSDDLVGETTLGT